MIPKQYYRLARLIPLRRFLEESLTTDFAHGFHGFGVPLIRGLSLVSTNQEQRANGG